jgi:hypothetical protein
MEPKDKLGFYLVGDRKFYAKSLALMAQKETGIPTKWFFNREVFQKIDWSIPIDLGLDELYRRRAQQLRENYDYLMLYYTGGQDSMNMLHVFLENNIFIDEIVMQWPEPMRSTFNDQDRSEANVWSEFEFAAAAHIRKISGLLPSGTRISYQDYSRPLIELLEQDDWWESLPMSTNITVSGIGRQIAPLRDRNLLRLNERSRSVAQILGIDKPLIWINDADQYHAYFMDVNCTHAPPLSSQFLVTKNGNIHFDSGVVTEYFYWTPDLPELVVKQSQLLKAACENNPSLRHWWKQHQTDHIVHFRDIMQSVIYTRSPLPEFQTGKLSARIRRPADRWFWESASSKVKSNYLEAIFYLGKNIDPSGFHNQDCTQGFASHQDGGYQL